MASDEIKMRITVEDGGAKKKLKGIQDEAQKMGDAVESQGRRLSERIFFTLSNMNMLFSGVSKAAGYLGERLAVARSHAEGIGSSKFFTGLSSGQIQRIKTQLESVGGSFDSFVNSYSRFNDMWSTRHYKPWGQGVMQAFAQLELDPMKAKNANELLKMTIDALLSKEDAGLRSSLARELGISDDLLLAASKNGRSGNEGLFFTDEELERAQKINNDIRQTRQEIDLIKDKLAAKWLLPLEEKFRGFQKGLWNTIGEWAGVVESPSAISDDEMKRMIKSGASLTDLFKLETERREGKNVDTNSSKSFLKRYFMNAGMTEAGAMGVIGNLWQESKFNPYEYNKSEGALGIAQWRNDRRTNLFDFAKSHGLDAYSLEGQAAFLVHELNTDPKYRKLLRLLMTTSDAGASAIMFDDVFERSDGKSKAERLEAAGVEASKYLANYNTNYSTSSSVTNNNVNMVINGVEGSNPVEIGNSIKQAYQNS